MLNTSWMRVLDLGLVPDSWVRFGVRRICETRLRETRRQPAGAITDHVELPRSGPVAAHPEAANVQHYEVPSAFFEAALGPRLEYSCSTRSDGITSLAEAETEALRQVAKRAELADGQRILELGCGWGSLSLFMADAFPSAQITAVSNSARSSYLYRNDGPTRRLPTRGLRTSTPIGHARSRLSPAPNLGRVRHSIGGACSSWRARSSSHIDTGRSGV